MKKALPVLLIAISFWLSGCKINRYYYIAEEPIALYELPSFVGNPVLTTSVGDTVSATGTKVVGLGGSIPVEFAGYRFYSPNARARFLRTVKVRPKRDRFLPGITYIPRQRYSAPAEYNNIPGNYGYTPSTGATIHTGPRGGRYYINSKGNKTYVPRSGGSRSVPSTYRSRASSSGSSGYRKSGPSYRSSGSRGKH